MVKRGIKQLVIQKIIETLQAELETYARAAKASHAEATAEENRAENKYDTRGLEASYLAAGQASKVVELEESITSFEGLLGGEYAADKPIGVGALVELELNGERAHYFIGTSAGGTEVTCGKHEVLLITAQSPLGSQLQDRQQGGQFELMLAGAKQPVQIIDVC
jgi:hypothetical protein